MMDKNTRSIAGGDGSSYGTKHNAHRLWQEGRRHLRKLDATLYKLHNEQLPVFLQQQQQEEDYQPAVSSTHDPASTLARLEHILWTLLMNIPVPRALLDGHELSRSILNTASTCWVTVRSTISEFCLFPSHSTSNTRNPTNTQESSTTSTSTSSHAHSQRGSLHDVSSKLQAMQRRMAEHYQSFCLPKTSNMMTTGRQPNQDPLGWCLQAIHQLYNEAEQDSPIRSEATSTSSTEQEELTNDEDDPFGQHVPVLLLQRLLPDCIESLRQEQEILSTTSTATDHQSIDRRGQSSIATNHTAREEAQEDSLLAGIRQQQEKEESVPVRVSITTIQYHSLAITLMENIVAASLKRTTGESLEDWLCRQFFCRSSNHGLLDDGKDDRYDDDDDDVLLVSPSFAARFTDEEQSIVGALVFDMTQYARLLVEHTQDVLDITTVFLKKKKDLLLSKKRNVLRQQGTSRNDAKANDSSSKEDEDQSSSTEGGSSSSASSSSNSKASSKEVSGAKSPAHRRHQMHQSSGHVVTPKPTTGARATDGPNFDLSENLLPDQFPEVTPNGPGGRPPSHEDPSELIPPAFSFHFLSQVLDPCEHWIVLTTQALDGLRPWQFADTFQPEDLLFRLWRTAIISLVHMPPGSDDNDEGEENQWRWEGVLWKMTNVVLKPSSSSSTQHETAGILQNTTTEEHHNPAFMDRAQQSCPRHSLNLLILRLVPLAPALTARFGRSRLWDLLRHIMIMTNGEDAADATGESQPNAGMKPASATKIREWRYILQAALLEGIRTLKQGLDNNGGRSEVELKDTWGSLLTLAVPDRKTTDPFDQLFCKEWNRMYQQM